MSTRDNIARRYTGHRLQYKAARKACQRVKMAYHQSHMNTLAEELHHLDVEAAQRKKKDLANPKLKMAYDMACLKIKPLTGRIRVEAVEALNRAYNKEGTKAERLLHIADNSIAHYTHTRQKGDKYDNSTWE